MAVPSDQLTGLALFALDHAVGSIVAGGPLVPFAVTEAGGDRTLTRFAGDLEGAQQAARSSVRTAVGIDRAVVAWDGYLTAEGVRTDAIFVEASEAGASESLMLAQRYHVTGRIKKRVEPTGNAAMLPPGDPLF